MNEASKTNAYPVSWTKIVGYSGLAQFFSGHWIQPRATGRLAGPKSQGKCDLLHSVHFLPMLHSPIWFAWGAGHLSAADETHPGRTGREVHHGWDARLSQGTHMLAHYGKSKIAVHHLLDCELGRQTQGEHANSTHKVMISFQSYIKPAPPAIHPLNMLISAFSIRISISVVPCWCQSSPSSPDSLKPAPVSPVCAPCIMTVRVHPSIFRNHLIPTGVVGGTRVYPSNNGHGREPTFGSRQHTAGPI